MRGVHSAVDDIRRNVFTEVARLAYEGGDYSRIDLIPYKIVPGEVAKHRHDVFLERAIVQERLRLAVGLPLQPVDVRAPASAGIEAAAAADDKFFEEPLVNIITFACNACPPKQVWVTNACQGCISHPCQAVCPKGAIRVDKDHHSVIDQDKCIKCGKCFNQCPYHAITKIERPCAAACGMRKFSSNTCPRAMLRTARHRMSQPIIRYGIRYSGHSASVYGAFPAELTLKNGTGPGSGTGGRNRSAISSTAVTPMRQSMDLRLPSSSSCSSPQEAQQPSLPQERPSRQQSFSGSDMIVERVSLMRSERIGGKLTYTEEFARKL